MVAHTTLLKSHVEAHYSFALEASVMTPVNSKHDKFVRELACQQTIHLKYKVLFGPKKINYLFLTKGMINYTNLFAFKIWKKV